MHHKINDLFYNTTKQKSRFPNEIHITIESQAEVYILENLKNKKIKNKKKANCSVPALRGTTVLLS